MYADAQLERRDGYAVFRATGETTLDDAVASVTSAIVAAREQSVKNLLVDISGLIGFEPPTHGERYLFVNEWATASQGVVRMSLIAERRMIDPRKYGVSVAHSLGFAANVFVTERAALEFERRLESADPTIVNVDFHTLHPLVVLALGRYDRAELYACAFAAGWVTQTENDAR